VAHGIKLNWYEPRRCWRLRKTINGKVKTFYVGAGASGPDDERARAAAFLEAERKLSHARQESALERRTDVAALTLVGVDVRLRKQAEELLDFLDSPDGEDVGILLAAKAKGMDVKLPVLLNDIVLLGHYSDENEELRTRVERLEAILDSQGRAASLLVLPLAKVAESFIAAKESEAVSKGLSSGHRRSFRGNVEAFIKWLAELPQPIEETIDLDARQSVLSEYREAVIEERIEEEYSAAWAKARLDKCRLFCEFLIERQYLSQLPRGIGRHWSRVGTDLPSPTHLTVNECRKLWKDADDRIKTAIALGLNCGYRQSDIVTLKRDEIDLEKREIRRQRHKTQAAQVHGLWDVTYDILEAELKRHNQTLVFGRGWTNISREVSNYIRGMLGDENDETKRTAKSLRSTGSQMIETVLGHSMPHVVDQYLGHTDKRMARHYRAAELSDLFAAIKEAEHRFALQN
jgi:integrase